jgi:hypothetical protein
LLNFIFLLVPFRLNLIVVLLSSSTYNVLHSSNFTSLFFLTYICSHLFLLYLIPPFFLPKFCHSLTATLYIFLNVIIIIKYGAGIAQSVYE